jgi:hypothetical protein
VWKTLDRHVSNVAKRLGAALARYLPHQAVPADNLGDLDVQQVRRVQGIRWVQQALFQCLRGPGA